MAKKPTTPNLAALGGVATEVVEEAAASSTAIETKAKAGFKYLPLPEVVKDWPVMYAVRLDGQDGYWPAFMEEREVPEVDPDHPWVYPTQQPGIRHPMASYEKPMQNVQRDDYGMPIKISVRCWVRADDRSVIYHEHTGAAAGTPYPPIVEIVPWCPIYMHDRNGHLTPHAEYFPMDDDSRFNKTPGQCQVCHNDPEIRPDNRAERIAKIKRGY